MKNSRSYKKYLNKRNMFVYLIIIIAAFIANVTINPSTKPLKDETLRCHAIDVKHGDSILFVMPGGETMLIDSGTKAQSGKVVSYLKEQSVKKIDLLVGTHPHADHIGGMTAVLDNFEVGEIWDSGYIHGSATQKNYYKQIKKKKIPFRIVKRGYRAKLGGAELEVLAPAEKLEGTHSDPNNNCVVMLVTYGDVSFLMTGDMEHEERKTISPLPRCTVLKMAHHGSHNGVDRRMLDETSPRFVIFSFAKDNSYGLPHKKTMKLLKNRADIIKLSTTKGDVVIKTDGKSVHYQRSRVM